MNKQSKSFVLLCSLFCLLQAGTVYLWSTYATDVAHQLQYSQTELAFIAGSGAWGLYLTGPVLGKFLQRHGVAATFKYSCIGLFCAYVMMALTVSKMFPLPKWFGFTSLYFFIVGAGSSGVHMSAVTVNLRNFSASKRGFALGTSVACSGLSAFVYSMASRLFYSTTVIQALNSDTTADHSMLDVQHNDAHKTLHEQGDTKSMTVVALDTVKFLLFLAFMTGACNYWVSRFVVDVNYTPNSPPNSPKATRISVLSPAETLKANTKALGSDEVLRQTGTSSAAAAAKATDLSAPAGQLVKDKPRFRSHSSTSVFAAFSGSELDDPETSPTKMKMHQSLPEVFFHLEAWLLFVVLMLTCGSGLMVISNVGSIIAITTPAALHDYVPKWQSIHVSILSLFNSAFRLASGVFADIIVARTHADGHQQTSYRLLKTRDARESYFRTVIGKLFLRPSRAHLLLLGCVAMMVGQSMFVPLLKPDGQVGRESMMGAAIVGAAYGTALCVAPTIVTDWYGVSNYAVNWGWISWGPALGGQTFNILFGGASDSLKRAQIEESLPSAITTGLHSHSHSASDEPTFRILPYNSSFTRTRTNGTVKSTIQDPPLVGLHSDKNDSTLASAPIDSGVLNLQKMERRSISSNADFNRPSEFFRKTALACLFAAFLTVLIILIQPEPKVIQPFSTH